MAYESDEERIAKLEEQVKSTTLSMLEMVKWHQQQGKMNLMLLNANHHEKTALAALMRFLSTQPMFADATTRQLFVDMVAKVETGLEQTQAAIAAAMKSIDQPSQDAAPEG